jgi:very-long-chain enoyl-CoA reductase
MRRRRRSERRYPDMTERKIGFSPRQHNVLSYSVALVVFVAVGLLRPGGAPGTAFALVAGLWSFHFLRRTLESAFLHAYSKPVVPLSDMLIEYVYYWGFAAWIAWTTSSPGYRLPPLPLLLVGISTFALAEAGNFATHLMLRRLRPIRSAERRLPRGFLFEYVSSPNYFFEVLSWAAFAVATQIWGSLAFFVAGTAILSWWAHQRHTAYRAQFDGQQGRELYPPARKRFVPWLY